MTTYYVKEGNRYIPVGMACPDIWEGLWLVQRTESSKVSSNLTYCYLRDLPEPVDVTKLASAALLHEKIVKVLMNSENRYKSTNDVAQEVVKALYLVIQ